MRHEDSFWGDNLISSKKIINKFVEDKRPEMIIKLDGQSLFMRIKASQKDYEEIAEKIMGEDDWISIPDNLVGREIRLNTSKVVSIDVPTAI